MIQQCHAFGTSSSEQVIMQQRSPSSRKGTRPKMLALGQKKGDRDTLSAIADRANSIANFEQTKITQADFKVKCNHRG